jgi:hypothetical protein
MQPIDPVIGTRHFVDGFTRNVFIDLSGKQYVIEDGDRIEGIFVDPDNVGFDPPVIAENYPQ